MNPGATSSIDPGAETPSGAAALLRRTDTIRSRAEQLLTRVREGESTWFTLHETALPELAAQVADITRQRYPDLNIPFHSRWRHFEAGGIDRTAELRQRLAGLTPAAQARAMIDLTVVSVLLDAGAGPQWRYLEPSTERWFERSEGLGVASWYAFTDGLFSSDPDSPLQVDAGGLRAVTPTRLAAALQAGPANALVGVDGRVQLLHRLADVLSAPGDPAPLRRPGGLYDLLVPTDGPSTVTAHDILSQLLTTMAGIWPADNVIGDQRLGDCWPHSALGGPGLSAGWMPFHKLSQWLTYSLLEPFGWSGIPVQGPDALTALPEYRNGGLLLDAGVLTLRDPAGLQQDWAVHDEMVVEWRALTVALLDRLAPLVRAELGLDAAALPLACVLEGGIWAAGRATAQRLRGGLPPFGIISDGTVF
jgi:hypothetical protein